MTKTKSTKRALILSALSLVLCVSMLVGSTFAWFTDSVTSANNIIKSGNLDVELEYLNGTNWEKVTATTNVFENGTLWEPGHTEVVYLRVSNLGSLALKYNLGVNIVNEIESINVAGDALRLSDYIKFDAIEGVTSAYADRAAARAAVTEADAAILSTGYTKTGSIEAGAAAQYVALVVYMPENVGNEANYRTGEVAPEITLGINLMATQYTYEEDSFDNQYDASAPWTGAVDTSWYNAAATEFTLYSAEDIAGLAELVNAGNDFAGKTIVLANDVDFAGIDCDSIGNSSFERTTEGKFTDNAVFKGTFDGQNNTISNLNVNAPDSATAALFGTTSGATIKNVIVNNASINSSCAAGVIVARAAKDTTIDNCHVTGAIDVYSDWAYAGGILGYGYANVTNCSVIADGTGTIVAANKNAVGGIVGWTYGTATTNCQVANLDLTGWANIGSIAGWITSGHTLSDCSAENVNLTKTRVNGHASIGVAAGGWLYNASKTTTVSNNEFANITLNGTYVYASSASAIYGSEYYGNTAVSVVAENNAQTNVTNNLVEVTAISNAEGLKNAVANGGNFYLGADVTVDANTAITVPSGKNVTIDLNGNKISATANKTGNQELFLVKGNMTVKNGSLELVAENNQGWNAMATIFDVTAGGSLNLDGVTANVSGTDMNFIVHLNNWGSATLNVNNCDFTTTYVAIRAFNSGYDMNTVTVKNTDFHGGRVFWVHNYTSEGKDDSTLTLDIYGNNNTTDSTKPVRFGFSVSTYYDINGNAIA